ncbi:pinensin family lanthipeptide [Roseivirga sp. BDSF3-8]
MKKKIALDSLKVKSFVTKIENSNRIIGASLPCSDSPLCNETFAERID